MVLALPAASAPPISVTAMSSTDGRPRRARNIVGSVVTRRSSMILGLVSANNDRSTTAGERRVIGDESLPFAPALTAVASGSAFVACVTRRPPMFAVQLFAAQLFAAPCSPAGPRGERRPHAEYYRS